MTSLLREESSRAKPGSFLSRDLGERLKQEPLMTIAQQQKFQSRALEEILFWDVIALSQQGSSSVSRALQHYRKLVRLIYQLRRQQASALFIPHFQAFVAVSMAVLFVFVLPVLWPEDFPSFLRLGRLDLFMMGIGGVLCGVATLYLMSQRPKRLAADLLSMVSFFSSLGFLLETGKDFVTSWRYTVDTLPLGSKVQETLQLPSPLSRPLPECLRLQTIQLPAPWQRPLEEVILALEAQWPVASLVQALADSLQTDLGFEWEDMSRKLSVVTVIPLNFILFPSAMFLLIGPRFIELMEVL
jgi:hypothetical protein